MRKVQIFVILCLFCCLQTACKGNTEQIRQIDLATSSITSSKEAKIALFNRLSQEQPDVCEDPLAAWIDLDLGADGLGQVESADLVFTCSKGSTISYVLSPVNGASYKIFYTDTVGYDDCVENLAGFSKKSIPDFSAGPICVLTNEGRMAFVQYVPDSWHSGYGGEASLLLRITVGDAVVEVKQ